MVLFSIVEIALKQPDLKQPERKEKTMDNGEFTTFYPEQSKGKKAKVVMKITFKKRFFTLWGVIYAPWGLIILLGGISLKSLIGFAIIQAACALVSLVDTHFALKMIERNERN